MRAASGSTQMLNSAAGVTLPSQQGAPPITTQRFTEAASFGSRSRAMATFVSGPRVMISMPGFSRTVLNQRVHGMARFRTPLPRLVAVIAKAVGPMEPIRNDQLPQQTDLLRQE